MTDDIQVSVGVLEKANRSLRAAMDPPPVNDRERDGAIQRFEYTIELSWRLIRKFLLRSGQNNVGASPKPIIRLASLEGWVDDVESWLELVEARNLTSHSYKDEIAMKVFDKAKTLPKLVDQLLEKLKSVK